MFFIQNNYKTIKKFVNISLRLASSEVERSEERTILKTLFPPDFE